MTLTLLIALLVTLCFWPIAPAQQARVDREFTDVLTSVTIENQAGVTVVQTWAGSPLRVIATRSGSSDAKLDSEVSFERPDQRVLRIVVRPVDRQSRINLHVLVPANIHLIVRGGNDAVVVKGSTASLSVETHTGKITLHLPSTSKADISIRSFEGAIESRLPINIFGPLDPQSLDGRIGGGGVPIILRSLRGNITLLPDDPARVATISAKSPDDLSALRSITADPVRSGPDKQTPSPISRGALASKLKEVYSSVGPKGDQPVDGRNAELRRTNDDVLRLEARLVNLNVKVTDTVGKNIPNLRKEEFLVFEDNVQQDLSYFEPISSPVSLVLLLDLSGSTRDKIKVMKQAAKKFVESLRGDDRVAIALFTTRFYLVSNFTSDRELLKDRIDDINNRGGDTSFYDATWAAFDLFNEIKEARKAIVILTDGVDSSMSDSERERGSDRSFDELLMRVIEEDATIYPIYLDTEYEIVVKGGSYSHEIYATARKQLEMLAEQTGGTLFKAARFEDLEGVYQRVASELHALYSLAYHAKDTRREGNWRKISVKVNRAGTVAKSKRGYFAR